LIPPRIHNDGIDDSLEALPDEVANKLLHWRKATLEREKTEAMLYLAAKVKNPDATANEIKSTVNSSDGRYAAVLVESMAECEYQRVLEKLMAAKKRASLRTAF
jgi:hypothetical protein